MITGASKADVSIILVDARKGILEQTHRHYFISNLLRISKVIVCVNKMDLVDFAEGPFRGDRKIIPRLRKRDPGTAPGHQR